MTYSDGSKRCWATRSFGDRALVGPRTPVRHTERDAPPADAMGVTVINRNQTTFMCRAYDGLFTRGGKWVKRAHENEPRLAVPVVTVGR